MARFIFRCKRRGCGHRWAVDYPIEKPMEVGGPARDRYFRRATGGQQVEPWFDALCQRCRGTRVAYHRVVSALHPEVPCDDRCRNAVGAVCVCSCGGANHGAGIVDRERSATA